MAQNCHWVRNNDIRATASRCRVSCRLASMLWPADGSRCLQSGRPAFFCHLPSHRSLRLCVICSSSWVALLIPPMHTWRISTQLKSIGRLLMVCPVGFHIALQTVLHKSCFKQSFHHAGEMQVCRLVQIDCTLLQPSSGRCFQQSVQTCKRCCLYASTFWNGSEGCWSTSCVTKRLP